MQTSPDQQYVMDAGFLDGPFSALISWPTGSGKTWIAERAIEKVLAKGLRAVYLTPIKALASELYDRWQGAFDRPVGIFTGDYGSAQQSYPVSLADAGVLIMTPEKLDLALRQYRRHLGWLAQLDLCVCDEFHLLGDVSRGARYEGMLLRLQALNPFVRILALSATLGNVAELACWLDAVSHRSSKRPVPLSWAVETFKNADHKPQVFLENLRIWGKGVLCFVQSRKRAEQLAKLSEEHGFRAAFHHAGLNPGQRTRVETQFRSGELDVLLATPTLEMGLNFGCRQVFLYDLQQWNGSGFEPLSVNTVWQRAGRAGRPGFDDQGEAVLLVPKWDRKSAQTYLRGEFEPIRSGLACPRALSEQVIVTVAAGYARTVGQLERFFGHSLGAKQHRLACVHAMLSNMISAGFLVESEEDGGRLKATRLGHIATRHMLSPQAVLLFERVRQTCEQLAFYDLLLVACASPDCQPVLSVDYEELQDLSEAIEREGSYLLQRSREDLEVLLGVGGKRLLASLKMAQVLRDWTRRGEAADVAELRNLAPFEVVRLVESVARMLVGLAAVMHVQEDVQQDPHEMAADWSEEVTVYERLVLLQRMTAGGLDEEQGTLALVPGIGAKWARKLSGLGIGDIEALACADVDELAKIRGLSKSRARQWIDQAEALVAGRDAFAYKETDAPSTEFSRRPLPQGVDPYRLRRALALSVDSMDAKTFYVCGGSDPHWIRRIHEGWTCDCADYQKHQSALSCKHLLAVQMTQDPVLRQLAEDLNAIGPRINLFSLWHGAQSSADPFGLEAAHGKTR